MVLGPCGLRGVSGSIGAYVAVMTTDSPEVLNEKDLAEIAHLNAEAEKMRAEALTASAQAEAWRHDALRKAAEAERAQLTLEHEKITAQRMYASDSYNHVYRFSGYVDGDAVRRAIDMLTTWHRTAPGCEIELVFNSPGGSVIDGFDLFDFIQELRRGGHRVVTSTRGMAASMGGILLQAGDVRVMGAESYMLIHQISTAVFGKVGEIDDEVAFLKLMSDRVLSIFATRCKEAFENGTATKPLTKAQINKGWARRDWWLSSSQALELGLCDVIR
jgi:ATP-dependent protease ClpP protease subunit